MPARLRIVLVEPQEAGNVGAVARAMKNFGFEDLVIVGPLPRNVEGHEIWWASGADDLLDRARSVPTLEEALHGVVRAFATSSLRGRNVLPDEPPSAILQERLRHSEDETVAVVFGREDSGLTLRESRSCHAVVQIPTNPDFPVMNLAQAVAVLCFAASDLATEIPRSEEEEPAARYELETRLHREAQKILREIGFLRPDNHDRIYDEIRSIASRARLTSREITLLLGFIHQAWWKLRQEAGDSTTAS